MKDFRFILKRTVTLFLLAIIFACRLECLSIPDGQAMPMDADVPLDEKELREMAEFLFKDIPGFDAAKIEETVQQARALDEQMRALPPEERAKVEQQMMQELDQVFSQAEQEVQPEVVKPPVLPEPEKKPIPEKKPSKEVAPKSTGDVIRTKEALERLITLLETFKTKTASLVIKEDSKIVTPKEWKQVNEGIDEALSYLLIASTNTKVLDILCTDEFKELREKISSTADKLEAPIEQIETPDTMGLQQVISEEGELKFGTELTSSDKVTSQRSLKKVVSTLKDVFDVYRLNWNLKRVLEKVVPEKIKKAEPRKEQPKAYAQSKGLPSAYDYDRGYAGTPASGYGYGGYDGYYPSSSGSPADRARVEGSKLQAGGGQAQGGQHGSYSGGADQKKKEDEKTEKEKKEKEDAEKKKLKGDKTATDEKSKKAKESTIEKLFKELEEKIKTFEAILNSNVGSETFIKALASLAENPGKTADSALTTRLQQLGDQNILDPIQKLAVKLHSILTGTTGEKKREYEQKFQNAIVPLMAFAGSCAKIEKQPARSDDLKSEAKRIANNYWEIIQLAKPEVQNLRAELSRRLKTAQEAQAKAKKERTPTQASEEIKQLTQLLSRLENEYDSHIAVAKSIGQHLENDEEFQDARDETESERMRKKNVFP
jgi:hypothetical protein